MIRYLGKLNNIYNGAVKNRLLQYELNSNEERKLEISKYIINGKINNSLQMLYRLRRLMNYQLSEEIDQIIRNKNSAFHRLFFLIHRPSPCNSCHRQNRQCFFSVTHTLLTFFFFISTLLQDFELALTVVLQGLQIL